MVKHQNFTFLKLPNSMQQELTTKRIPLNAEISTLCTLTSMLQTIIYIVQTHR